MTKYTQSETELRQLKSELVLRGMTLSELAKKTGLALGTVKNVACGQHRGMGAKLAINEALGVDIFHAPTPIARMMGQIADAAKQLPKMKLSST
jgi:transcriptional regulator with XRE-family HTH domain